MNVFDVLREKLEERKQKTRELRGKPHMDHGTLCGLEAGIDNAIEIVNQVEQQYNDGWILCNSGILPEEHDSIFAKLKGTDRWKTGMFEKMSDEVYVTIEDEKGSKTTTHAHTIDGKWSSDLLRAHKTYRVIAWKPLPKPYRGSE